MTSYRNESLCPLCDTYHVPGQCLDGLTIRLLFCPRCRQNGKGDGVLVSTGSGQACAVCGYGTTTAPRTARKGKRRKKGSLKRHE